MTGWFANILQNATDFSNTLNTSIAAGWMVLAVILLRFLLKKAPKWSHVLLWGLVAVRLLLPVSIESVFSLIPSGETLPREIMTAEGNTLQNPAYLEVISNPMYAGEVTIELGTSVDRVQIQMLDMTFLWMIGIMVLLLYTFISYYCLQRKIRTAVRLQGNVFQSEHVSSPFVFGVIRPRIYVPFKIETQQLEHVIAHEQAHIRRKDHWWKPLGFLLLTIHWFNPLMWLAYVLLCRDIELACDEKVIKNLDNEQRADYTQVLVSCSKDRHSIAACPLAFGETGVKKRVKNMMNYKKPTFMLMLVAVIACVLLIVCFLTNPKETTMHDIYTHNGYTVMHQQPIELTLSVDKALLPDTIYTSEGYVFEEGEVVAYQTDHTTIYLLEAMLSNESEEQLYFIFDCSYDIANYGSLISPLYVKNEKGVVSNHMSLSSRDLKDGTDTYPEALSVRGQGPGEVMMFYVSKDACKAAKEEIAIQIECNQIYYAKEGYEEEATKLALYEPQEMQPTLAEMTGAFDSYLYIPREDGNYRYERCDVNLSSVTRGKLIYRFTEKADPADVTWEVYALKEYPDLSAVLATTGAEYQYVYQYSPPKRSAPDALEKAIKAGCVVHMDGDVTKGQERWELFVDAVEDGKTSSVQVAMYYTLDQESCSEEYYEANKEDYPALYLFNLMYDEDGYTLKWQEGDKEYVRNYQHLMHYTGEAPTPHATYDTYSRYVLTNDQEVTWEDLQRGMISSQFGDYIDHYTVYVDLE